MKFKKIVIDGKEYFQRIDEENQENVNKDSQKEEIPQVEEEIIDCDIEDTEEPAGGEKFRRDAQEFFEKVGVGAKDFGERFASGAKDFGERFASGAKDFGEKFVSGAKDLGKRIKKDTERLFNRDKTLDPNSREAKLLRLLPYMSKEQTHEVCEKIIACDDAVAKLDVATVMPFLSAADCDAIFKRCIQLENTKYDLAAAIPFVSESCLSDIVDAYIDGQYPGLDIDAFYPFLPDREISRIFYHIIEQKEQGEEQSEQSNI